MNNPKYTILILLFILLGNNITTSAIITINESPSGVYSLTKTDKGQQVTWSATSTETFERWSIETWQLLPSTGKKCSVDTLGFGSAIEVLLTDRSPSSSSIKVEAYLGELFKNVISSAINRNAWGSNTYSDNGEKYICYMLKGFFSTRFIEEGSANSIVRIFENKIPNSKVYISNIIMVSLFSFAILILIRKKQLRN